MSIDKVREDKLIDIIYNLVLEGTDGYYKNTKHHLVNDNNAYIELLDFISQAEARGREEEAKKWNIELMMLQGANQITPEMIKEIREGLLTKIGGTNEK